MRPRSSLAAYCLAFIASLLLATQPLAAQSVLRDAETEELLRDLAYPLIEASELEPENVELVLINDPSINAFVAGGQVVYVHAGLLNAAESANEVQGVIAHELGHILGLSHDGDLGAGNTCEKESNEGSVMAPMVAATFSYFHWSSCSAGEYHYKSNQWKCLRNQPKARGSRSQLRLNCK